MNILYFSYEYPPFFVGGLGTYAYEMSRRFVRLGHNVTVFSNKVEGAPTKQIVDGVEVHRPITVDVTELLAALIPDEVKRWPLDSQRYFAGVLLYNILSTTKAVNLLSEVEGRKFDLVVAHDWLSAVAGIVTKRALKKPMVIHLHSVEEGRVGDGSPSIKALERGGAKAADIVITVSYAMRDQLISLGYDEKKIRVVYNGVDEQKYNPDNVPPEKVAELRQKLGVGNDPMLLFIGRLTWVKGADTLVRAMPAILSEVPNAKLVLVGKGDQENMIKEMISHMGIQNSVKCVFSYVPEEERITYYAACDVAVFPSKYEPFGIVCTEAMSMGKPVIVGAKGTSGFREQVIPFGPKRCGSHINPDDPNDIAKFAVELLKDEGLRKKLGNNARNRVLEEFALDKVVDRTLHVYWQAISDAGG
ncbi:MAG: glycosyltransferase family 4 protein [Candidatus Hadarchaeales archaeon]